MIKKYIKLGEKYYYSSMSFTFRFEAIEYCLKFLPLEICKLIIEYDYEFMGKIDIILNFVQHINILNSKTRPYIISLENLITGEIIVESIDGTISIHDQKSGIELRNFKVSQISEIKILAEGEIYIRDNNETKILDSNNGESYISFPSSDSFTKIISDNPSYVDIISISWSGLLSIYVYNRQKCNDNIINPINLQIAEIGEYIDRTEGYESIILNIIIVSKNKIIITYGKDMVIITYD